MREEQLTFELPAEPAMGREDFYVSPENAQAVALISNWRNWPATKLWLSGLSGSGKTHLAHVWAAQSGARIVAARMLTPAEIPALVSGPVVVEDIDALSDTPEAQTALFHLYNLATAEAQPVLFTAACPAARLDLSLPDLNSRLQSLTTVTLGAPDDALLGAVLMKQFADRQLRPTPDTIPYLVRHIDRSFEAARRVVARLDHHALTTGRKISRALARELL